MKNKIIFLAISIIIPFTEQVLPQGFENFITRDGYRLMDGAKEYRFLSYNIPNLNYVEDEMEFTKEYPFVFPDEFEIRDAIATVKELGGNVIRIYSIPVRDLSLPASVPTHVLAPGIFSEDAYKVNDMMLAVANEMNVRIIFSLLNCWQWLGGRPQYAAFRGKTQEEFWTDKQLIEDFKKTIEYTLNRTNTITGVKYKDDKSILCWETGNELTSPIEWTIEITRYIKSLDKNHLVMDGYHAINDTPFIEAAIEEPSIDILSSHHYEFTPFEEFENIENKLKVINGRKVYVLGEIGFKSTNSIERMINKVIANNQIAGALVWSLRFHRSKGGFYWHSEPFGYGVYKAYHWPGFPSGNKYDETNFMEIYRQKAYEIQGLEAPAIKKPEKPVLLDIDEIYYINWKGSVGASGYNVERSESPDGPWELVGYNISDADIPYIPLFHDKTAQLSKKYYYRVTALNSAGTSDPSNIVGPVDVNRLALIDDLNNTGIMYQGENVTIETGDDRKYKEDTYRLSGNYASEVFYYVPGNFDEFRLYAFEGGRYPSLFIYTSEDGENYTKITPEIKLISQDAGSYGYLRPKIYSYDKADNKIKFFKIFYERPCQISRVEIFYK